MDERKDQTKDKDVTSPKKKRQSSSYSVDFMTWVGRSHGRKLSIGTKSKKADDGTNTKLQTEGEETTEGNNTVKGDNVENDGKNALERKSEIGKETGKTDEKKVERTATGTGVVNTTGSALGGGGGIAFSDIRRVYDRKHQVPVPRPGSYLMPLTEEMKGKLKFTPF